jgi:4-hydroxy-2-oxoheptanedioate aldolase
VRGLASTRAAEYGQTIPLSKYVEEANAQTLVVIQIETANGVERIHEIINVEDVDVIFIGPTDLSHSLGVPGQVQHASVQAAMRRVADVVGKSNVALGAFASSAQGAREWRDRGARYIVVSLEVLLRSTTQQFLEAVKK